MENDMVESKVHNSYYTELLFAEYLLLDGSFNS